MAKIYGNIEATLTRADEVRAELLKEYQSSLDQKQISAKATQLTHDICDLLNSALDRIARRYWEKHVLPQLTEDERKKATVYFPVAKDVAGFDSTLGRWQWKRVRNKHQAVYDYMSVNQPYSLAKNKWLSVVKDLAVQGKHIDLVPQKRTEDRRITVAGPGGAVSWGSGVTFGQGVSIMGAPVDPRTQRIVPTAGLTERIEVWVSFEIEGYGINAAGFCEEACRETRRIVQEMTDQFELS